MTDAKEPEMTREQLDTEIEKTVLSLIQRDGVATPDAFIGAVHAEDHPLHHCLEWDNDVAAHNHRKHQARQLMGRVTITLDGQRAPAFVHANIVRDDGSRREGYVTLGRAITEPEIRAQVLAEAKAGLAGWSRRLASIEIVGPVLTKLQEAQDLLAEEA